MKYFSLFIFTLLLYSCIKEDCEEVIFDLQACIDNNLEYSQIDQKYRDYVEHRTKWECLNFKNYEVTYESFTQACPGGILRLRVEDGEVVEQTDLPSKNPYINQASCIGLSIEDLFSIIRYAVDSAEVYPNYAPRDFGGFDSLQYVAYQTYVSYDSINYYPDSIWVDMSGFYEDDELSVKLSDFKEIK